MVSVSRNLKKERKLWHNSSGYLSSLGCTTCLDKAICGGLNISANIFSCESFCCGKPQSCDAVCRLNNNFVDRVREVGGFSLNNIARTKVLHAPNLPKVIPIIYHRSKRNKPFTTKAATISLYQMFKRNSVDIKFKDKRELCDHFGIGSDTMIILSGTAMDPPLERWWALGIKRKRAIQALRKLGITLVTAPNFSLFTDQPRWDDLHNIKRIAITWQEFASCGLPAALHVNARTDFDWIRWENFISDRPEIKYISFEFGTGAGWPNRRMWHVEKLCHLARNINRPLHLLIRGGSELLPYFDEVFRSVHLLDTSVFIKTIKRQKALISGAGELHWGKFANSGDQTLDSMLNYNFEVVTSHFALANN